MIGILLYYLCKVLKNFAGKERPAKFTEIEIQIRKICQRVDKKNCINDKISHNTKFNCVKICRRRKLKYGNICWNRTLKSGIVCRKTILDLFKKHRVKFKHAEGATRHFTWISLHGIIFLNPIKKLYILLIFLPVRFVIHNLNFVMLSNVYPYIRHANTKIWESIFGWNFLACQNKIGSEPNEVK